MLGGIASAMKAVKVGVAPPQVFAAAPCLMSKLAPSGVTAATMFCTPAALTLEMGTPVVLKVRFLQTGAAQALLSHTMGALQVPQLTVRELPQLSVPVVMSHVALSIAQRAASDSGTQPVLPPVPPVDEPPVDWPPVEEVVAIVYERTIGEQDPDASAIVSAPPAIHEAKSRLFIMWSCRMRHGYHAPGSGRRG